jgi:hypothetical protein
MLLGAKLAFAFVDVWRARRRVVAPAGGETQGKNKEDRSHRLSQLRLERRLVADQLVTARLSISLVCRASPLQGAEPAG